MPKGLMPRFKEEGRSTDEIIQGLQHAYRWIRSEPHETDCPAFADRQSCDCGKTLAQEQVQAAIKRLWRTL
ncbi:hypothetical protein [Methylobacter sp.]|uniref:hypothetical protein n=1 Tax=Methylobacter sp. TaxID=2051955 RepID=UPI00122766E6|nr:hypothetical protein [Methylobacter sp.]TAK59538.1 MAG: hypothetical protein EPO18_20465 [Methylobacter sp.]